jgi:uncharacterized protein YdeI (YjbR/CyaY-like superfamily)
MVDDLRIVSFESTVAFEAWLGEHHASSPGIWLKLRKKAPGVVALDYGQALDVALCYGWIDGQKASFDDLHGLQRFTPRRQRSKWSRINCGKAEALKADGRWDAAYDGQKTASVPDDLAEALAANPGAAAFFASLDSRNRYAVLYRIQDAKKADTRMRRIEKYVAMLAEEKKIYP